MKQIAENVYTEDGFSVPPKLRGSNPSFVTTSDGIVIIDTPMHPIDALRWRNDLARRGEVRYIVNTHHHIDHITGNTFFGGAVVSHEGIRELFLAPVESVVATHRLAEVLRGGEGIVGYMKLLIGEREPENLPLFDGYRLKPPTITFTDRLNLYVGQYTFELIHMPGHTASHIGVYLPQNKVFFAGDNFTTRTQPSLAHCLPLEWVKSLKQIEAMDIEVVVPGHGEVCDRSVVKEFRLFLQECIRMVRSAIKQGMSKEEAAARLSFEELYPGKNGPSAVHPGPEQQRLNVLRLYEMLSR